ncbi:MAG: hypothetical protein AB8B69_05775 [Chitinophagales bacterium]
MTDTSSANRNFGNTKVLLLAILAGSLIVNGILFFKNQQKDIELQSCNEFMEVEHQLLQESYQVTLEELESYQIENSEKSESLLALEGEIEVQKAEIETLLTNNRYSRKKLSEAKLLIESLRVIAHDYKGKVEGLLASNAQLNQENGVLKTDITQKTAAIDELTVANEELNETTTLLASEKTTLSEERDILQGKVKRASVLDIDAVDAAGVRFKNNGKELVTKNDKRAEKIKVCFEVQPNPVAELGQKEVYVQIMSPEGTVLAVDDMGSGIFTDAETSQPMKYTAKSVIDFKNQEETHCMYWDNNTDFSPGTYTTAVYHEGYQVGSTNFELK